jgi:hypothetical protein
MGFCSLCTVSGFILQHMQLIKAKIREVVEKPLETV